MIYWGFNEWATIATIFLSMVAITRELTEALRTNKTIDWNMKESARAGMRRIVKRLLKKYKYPPEGQEAALEIIMAQCEMWSENNLMGEYFFLNCLLKDIQHERSID